jgi:hypothetical protein
VDGGGRGLSPSFCFVAFLAALPSSIRGQLTVRARLPWRTIETQHFAFHYPVELEAWTRDLATHIEAIDSAVHRRRLRAFAQDARHRRRSV